MLAALRSRFSRLGSSKYTLPPETLKRVFYEAKPPWWARFTWAFIAADLLVTSTMVEATWTRWTQPADLSNEDDRKSGTQWVPRPAWQRAGLCSLHLGMGVGLAFMLFIGRSRVVRRLHILPHPTTHQKSVFIQSSLGTGTSGTGALVPFQKARIHPGRDASEVILRVEGVRGHWWVGMRRARVRGEEKDMRGVREAFMKAWGVKGAQQDRGTVGGAWIDGPIVRNV